MKKVRCIIAVTPGNDIDHRKSYIYDLARSHGGKVVDRCYVGLPTVLFTSECVIAFEDQAAADAFTVVASQQPDIYIPREDRG
jgi:hypothetical protein